jgi:tetratricopeptide (TPR) repeat protein
MLPMWRNSSMLPMWRNNKPYRHNGERAAHLERISALQGLLSLTPTEFELAIAELFTFWGYSRVEHTGGGGDLAADIICYDAAGQKTVVQCKRYWPGNLVGSPEVQKFIGMIVARHYADHGVFVTTSGYTEPALTLGREHDIRMIDGTELVAHMQKFRTLTTQGRPAMTTTKDAAKVAAERGERLSSQGQYEEALAAYEEAVKLDPEEEYHWIDKAMVLEDLERYEEALAACEEALRLEPGAALYWHDKAKALQDLGRYEEALGACEQALALYPQSTYAWTSKIDLLKQLGRNAEAVAAARWRSTNSTRTPSGKGTEFP